MIKKKTRSLQFFKPYSSILWYFSFYILIFFLYFASTKTPTTTMKINLLFRLTTHISFSFNLLITVILQPDPLVTYCSKGLFNNYRTRATIGHSRLVGAPVGFQAKKHFLCAFYVVICRLKKIFGLKQQPLCLKIKRNAH